MMFLGDTPPKWLEDIEALAIFGQRMREARELSDFPVMTAARLIGIKKQSLRRIETGLSVDEMVLVTPALIVNAARVYEVTTDYLFGLVEDGDWEGRTNGARLYRAEFNQRLHTQLYIIARDIAKLDRQMKTAAAQIDAMLDAVAYTVEAIARFRELNDGFDDMPGGARLALAATEAEKRVDDANHALVRREIFSMDFLHKERGGHD